MGQSTTTYLLLFSGLSLLFYFAGLVEDSNPFIIILLHPENMTTTAFYATLLTAIGGGATVIFIGWVTKDLELAAMTAVTGAMIPLLWNFIAVFSKMYAINAVLSLLFFAPILLLFIVNMIDFWRGRD
jgi:hypothetical protein